jgi:hypothetical protein
MAVMAGRRRSSHGGAGAGVMEKSQVEERKSRPQQQEKRMRSVSQAFLSRFVSKKGM